MARRTRARGHIEERPNGKFRAVVYAGKDPFTGRDRYLREQADNEKLAPKGPNLEVHAGPACC